MGRQKGVVCRRFCKLLICLALSMLKMSQVRLTLRLAAPTVRLCDRIAETGSTAPISMPLHLTRIVHNFALRPFIAGVAA